MTLDAIKPKRVPHNKGVRFEPGTIRANILIHGIVKEGDRTSEVIYSVTRLCCGDQQQMTHERIQANYTRGVDSCPACKRQARKEAGTTEGHILESYRIEYVQGCREDLMRGHWPTLVMPKVNRRNPECNYGQGADNDAF